MSDVHNDNKALLGPLRAALYDYDAERVATALDAVFAPDAAVHLAHPFEDLGGAAGLLGEALAPLQRAMRDLERRDTIVIAGPDPYGESWVGCCGHYTGTWTGPFCDIPASGQQAAMRFHEFYRVADGRVVEMQAVWDLPELMMQSGTWPMGPSLGREWHVPGPGSNDGIVAGPRDDARSEASLRHVVGMLGDMVKHPTGPVEAMNLEHWWHPRFSWYGPSGIGTARGVDGFRRWHQIPFLAAMPDRGGGYDGEHSYFADGCYVAVTAWPGMHMTFSGDGWLGIAPVGRRIDMRSLDFWRVEQSLDPVTGSERLLIRENWVLVDLLHVWHQLGVDVLARMREVSASQMRNA